MQTRLKIVGAVIVAAAASVMAAQPFRVAPGTARTRVDGDTLSLRRTPELRYLITRVPAGGSVPSLWVIAGAGRSLRLRSGLRPGEHLVVYKLTPMDVCTGSGDCQECSPVGECTGPWPQPNPEPGPGIALIPGADQSHLQPGPGERSPDRP